MNNSDDSWRKYGETDPYFGVISDPKFERRNLNETSLKEFFQSGEDYVEALFDLLRTHASLPFFAPKRALEYGCGVGRILIPLTKRCGHVTGVDVSEGMLKESQENCSVRKISNVSFLPAANPEDYPGPFDLIHSFIVFQHIPQEHGMKILSTLIDSLAEGGIAVVHLMYLRNVSKLKNAADWIRARSTVLHVAGNLLKGNPAKRPLMQMNPYDLNRVFALLQHKNCHLLYVDFLNNAGYWGAILYIERKNVEAPSNLAKNSNCYELE